MDKLVSVNITTYNREKLLARCLDSVLSQSYKNIEVIIVDDCSTDSTAAIARKYQEQDNRIKYFCHKTNKGNAFARNTALEHCTGHYVAFMDDDDEWIDEHKISKQVELFDSLPDDIAVICTGVVLVPEKGNRREKIVQRPSNLTEHILAHNGIIYSPTVMTKRSIMIKVGGFDEQTPRGVDSEFYRTCIVRYGYDIYFMPDVTTAIYEFGVDRMTQMDAEDGLLSHVANFELKLNKYEKELKRYPVSRASIELTLARLNCKLYKFTKKVTYRNAFKRYAGSGLNSHFSLGNIIKVMRLFIQFALSR